MKRRSIVNTLFVFIFLLAVALWAFGQIDEAAIIDQSCAEKGKNILLEVDKPLLEPGETTRMSIKILVYPTPDPSNETPPLVIPNEVVLSPDSALYSATNWLVVEGGGNTPREHAVDLYTSALRALLAGEPAPKAAEVEGRVTYRTTHTVSDVPAHLGFPPSPPPPAEWLPPYAARTMRAVGVVLSAMFDVAVKKKEEAKIVRGLAASPGTYEGRARVVLGAEQFSKVEQGDVQIARTTCPSYNVLLPLLGGIVTDRGGLLSHAAIVAREYGMPAVVGTSEATKLIVDGARVRVDGAAGEVQGLS